MKGLIAVVVLAVLALLAYNYVQTGRLAILPSSASRDERALQGIEERFDTARRRFEAAGRAAGVAGVDSTADAETARREIESVDADLDNLRAHLAGALRAKADQLKREIEAFKDEMR